MGAIGKPSRQKVIIPKLSLPKISLCEDGGPHILIEYVDVPNLGMCILCDEDVKLA